MGQVDYVNYPTLESLGNRIATGGPLIVWKMGPGGTPHYANPHYVKHYAIV